MEIEGLARWQAKPEDMEPNVRGDRAVDRHSLLHTH